MTTTLPSPTLQLPARSGGFTGLLRAEWIKLTSVRSTLWTLALMTVTAIVVSVLISAITASQWDGASTADRQGVVDDPVGTIFGALGLAELVICVLGVLVITSEYSTGTIRASVLAVPRRSPMLVAKAVVFAALTLVVGEIAAFASFFAGAGLLQSHAPVSLDDPGVLRAVAGTGLFLAAMSLVALGAGALIRHTAGAIAGVIGFVLVLSPLASSLPGTVGEHVSAYLPTNAGQLIVFAHPDPEALLNPWQGLAVCAVWGVALLAVASLRLKRRDV
ncbi:ABC transporter permease [Streptomyces sp. RTGN2]|uniref:ABC transporter permease n=1 Tax=Streptomyces sp. RTGN2 TaxID=3016525 RepID=UPI00255242D7|nr:ABC transporter permease [Streptomyces sp. RTGN2]